MHGCVVGPKTVVEEEDLEEEVVEVAGGFAAVAVTARRSAYGGAGSPTAEQAPLPESKLWFSLGSSRLEPSLLMHMKKQATLYMLELTI